MAPHDARSMRNRAEKIIRNQLIMAHSLINSTCVYLWVMYKNSF